MTAEAAASPPRNAIVTVGFGTTVVMWAVGYVCRMPPGLAPNWLVLILMLVCLLLGGYLLGRWAGWGWRGGALAGLLSSTVNLLILGSVLTRGSSPNDVVPSALLWIPGWLAVGAMIGAVGALIARGGSTRRILGRRSTGQSALRPASWWLSAFVAVSALATLLAVIAGGLVTSADAGLAVPDWPNSFGSNMFLYPLSRMTGGVYYEHAHRLYGSLVGLTTIVLAIMLWRWDDSAAPSTSRDGEGADLSQRNEQVRTEPAANLAAAPRPRPDALPPSQSGISGLAADAPAASWSVAPPMRIIAIALVAAVIVQGVMGGLRVTETNLTFAVVHGIFGQVFFVCVGLVWAMSTRTWRRTDLPRPSPAAATDRTLTSFLAAVVFLQLVFGALYRHLYTEQTPLPWPAPIHLILAAVVGVTAVVVGLRACVKHPQFPMLRRFGRALVVLVLLQLALGFASLIAVLARRGDPSTAELFFATAHQANGALIFTCALQLLAWTHRAVAPFAEPEGVVRGSVVQ